MLSPVAATPVDDLIWAGCRLAAEEGTGHCVPCRVGTLRAQISFIRVDNTLFCPYTCIHNLGVRRTDSVRGSFSLTVFVVFW